MSFFSFDFSSLAIPLSLVCLCMCLSCIYLFLCVSCVFILFGMKFSNSFSDLFKSVFNNSAILSSNIQLCPFFWTPIYMNIRTFNYFLYFSVTSFSILCVFLCFIFFTLYWSAFEFTNLSCLILNFRYFISQMSVLILFILDKSPFFIHLVYIFLNRLIEVIFKPWVLQ